MDTHQRPVEELTEQGVCAYTWEHVRVPYLSMLAECLIKSALDMQLCVYLCTLKHFVCLWRYVHLCQCSECSQQCADG